MFRCLPPMGTWGHCKFKVQGGSVSLLSQENKTLQALAFCSTEKD